MPIYWTEDPAEGARAPQAVTCALCGGVYTLDGPKHVCEDLAAAEAWNRAHRQEGKGTGTEPRPPTPPGLSAAGQVAWEVAAEGLKPRKGKGG